MAEIVWGKTISDENKTEIEKYLNPFLFLVPNWAQKIFVYVSDGENKGDVAGMRARFQYREVDINIYGYWFTKGEEEKQDAIIHELCHLHNYPLYYFADRLISNFVKDNDSKSTLKIELENYLEGGTQDLTFAIMNKFQSAETERQQANRKHNLDLLLKDSKPQRKKVTK